MDQNKEVIIIGAGLSGLVVARILADSGYKVNVYERRDTIGGNVFDYLDNGILVQKYGPHIFHTNNQEVVDFLSKYTDWNKYTHKVLGMINNQAVPIPFNLTSLEKLFPNDKSLYIESVLVNEIGMNKKVPILELQKNPDSTIRDFANFVYENVFHHYTLKQWGMEPTELDPAVMQRVPVNVSYEDHYFTDSFQMMPKDGFTKMLNKMVKSPLIKIHYNSDYTNELNFDLKNKVISRKGEIITCPIIYTGCLDELFNYKYQPLPYRTLDFVFEKLNQTSFQAAAVVNYPNSESFTRISEFSKFTSKPQKTTIICKEYSRSYNKDKQDIPYYPIEIQKNKDLYNKYATLAQEFSNLYPLGRLAEYRYLNMDVIIANAIELVNKIRTI
ncbi:MAG: UDP-galactopyranose mutase [Bacilli bacterium]|nr:UDP-galactopyranose mutase [Bacilli bacterium]